MSLNDRFEVIAKEFREIALLEATHALLEWDERTGLPERAGAYRAEQATLLSGMVHRRKTDQRIGDELAELAMSELVAEPSSPQAAAILRLHKDFQRNKKVPIELVEALSKATVLGQQAWEKARAADDWEAFRPHMEEVYRLRREEAERIRQDGQSLYDALLSDYEEGAQTSQLTKIFAELRDGLVELVQRLADAPNRPTGASWKRAVPVGNQRQVSKWVAEQIGFSFDSGRLDETTHPFCTTLGPHDCRILTRYHQDYFPTAFYGTLHEAGHGLYEQGLPSEWYGLAPGKYASLGVHESQSRIWENFVGRSQAFWSWCFPLVQEQVAGAWKDLSAEDVYRDANLVQPSLIRVEADEVTYNLHILIRFEIEQALIAGEMAVADAPDAWNQRYEHYLGIKPPSHRDGILQDVHWSAGLVGYFPTYTLGNLYGAQLMQAAAAATGDLEAQYASGDFKPLLHWMQQNVHQHGFCLHPSQLVEQAAGAPLSAAPLLDYLRGKLYPIYGV
ncbi:MAG: carboxypeptidase M32 [Planctomycetota bacterium]|nr:carboxypeptidase M32 [Planctomycetota bacterium]